jgi:hypothetical protein
MCGETGWGADEEVGRDVVARREGEGRGGQDGADGRDQTGGGGAGGAGGQTGKGGASRGVPDGGGVWQTGRGVARQDRVEYRTGICGGRTG